MSVAPVFKLCEAALGAMRTWQEATENLSKEADLVPSY